MYLIIFQLLRILGNPIPIVSISTTLLQQQKGGAEAGPAAGDITVRSRPHSAEPGPGDIRVLDTIKEPPIRFPSDDDPSLLIARLQPQQQVSPSKTGKEPSAVS